MGLTLQALGDAFGIDRASVSEWESGKSNPKQDKFPLLARLLGTSVEYLMEGRGRPALRVIENVAPAQIGSRRVPLISYVQAGGWMDAADAYVPGDAGRWIMTDLELSGGAFALEIKGDSMLPDFREGDVVIIDPAVGAAPGDFVVAKNSENEATFKKYRPRGLNESGQQVFELVPLNSDYPTRYSDRESIRVIGVMVEHRKYRRR